MRAGGEILYSCIYQQKWGWERSQTWGLAALGGSHRSGAEGWRCWPFDREDWKPRAQRASAREVHVRCDHNNSKCACETIGGVRQRHLPKCTSREGQTFGLGSNARKLDSIAISLGYRDIANCVSDIEARNRAWGLETIDEKRPGKLKRPRLRQYVSVAVDDTAQYHL
eukprot:6185368-Pleurochrysis_carterae.AAC.1